MHSIRGEIDSLVVVFIDPRLEKSVQLMPIPSVIHCLALGPL